MGGFTDPGEGRAWVMQTVQGSTHMAVLWPWGCRQPRGQALTPPPIPAGSASFRNPHLRLSTPHAPDGQEGGHGAGPGRPREGDCEQRQPLQPSLPGRAHHAAPLPRPTPPCRPAQGMAVGCPTLSLPTAIETSPFRGSLSWAGPRHPRSTHSQPVPLADFIWGRDSSGGSWRVAD